MKKQNVIVDAIYPAKEGKNQDYSTIQVSSTEVNKNVATMLLGGNGFEKKRVAFHTIKNSVISELGIKVGDNLGSKLGADLRLTITENTEGGLGFSEKMIPAAEGRAERKLTSGGKQIFRKVELTDANAQDSILKADTVEVPAETMEA